MAYFITEMLKLIMELVGYGLLIMLLISAIVAFIKYKEKNKK